MIYDALSIDDLDEVSGLYRRYLNGGDTVREMLRGWFEAPRFTGVKCLDGGAIVGATSAKAGVEFTCGHEDIARLVKERWAGYDIFTWDLMIVLPEFRGHRIATNLVLKLRENLKKLGCERLIAEGWVIKAQARCLNFNVYKYMGPQTDVGEYPDFYRDIGKFGMTCPVCGNAECVCGAVVSVIDTA